MNKFDQHPIIEGLRYIGIHVTEIAFHFRESKFSQKEVFGNVLNKSNVRSTNTKDLT